MRSVRALAAFVISTLSFVVSSPDARADHERLRFLSMADPFAVALNENAAAAKITFGFELSSTLLGYEPTRRAIVANSQRSVSAFDLIAVDILWMPELTRAGVLSPISDDVEKPLEAGHFFIDAWRGGVVDGELFAIPIQPHAEILFFRQDWFADAQLEPPRTTEDVLAAAKRLTERRGEGGGVCWNGASGAALGQQMLHFAAAHGASILEDDGGIGVSHPGWRQAFDYAAALTAVSPSTINALSWDSRIAQFRLGGCAMTYGWTARAADLHGGGGGKAIGFVGAPNAPGKRRVTPLGVWSLAIPSNLAPERRAAAVRALKELTSLEATSFFFAAGVSAAPRRLAAESYAAAPDVALAVEKLAAAGELATWMRPPAPKLHEATEIIGVEAHAALFRNRSIDQALQRIQARLAQLERPSR